MQRSRRKVEEAGDGAAELRRGSWSNGSVSCIWIASQLGQWSDRLSHTPDNRELATTINACQKELYRKSNWQEAIFVCVARSVIIQIAMSRRGRQGGAAHNNKKEGEK